MAWMANKPAAKKAMATKKMAAKAPPAKAPPAKAPPQQSQAAVVMTDDPAQQPTSIGAPPPHDVGHKMVKQGKATHPHWRVGAKDNKHAARMYSNADTAHAHMKTGPGAKTAGPPSWGN